MKIVGKHSGQLDAKRLREIEQMLSGLDWVELEQKYQYKSTDAQQNIVQFSSHNVVYYKPTPEELIELDNYFNKLVNTYEF